VEPVCGDERFLIQTLPLLPRGISEEPEIGVAQVLQKNETGGLIVPDYFGNWDAVLIKKPSDICEI
jgi:hypothetical protein